MKINKLIAAVMLLMAATVQADISRAAFTNAIEGREPVEKLTELGNDSSSVFFFTEIINLKGHTITHRWEFNGESKYEMTFNVGADRWRVWSSKTLAPEQTGEWKVVVLDDSGAILRTEVLSYKVMAAEPVAQ